MHRFDITADVEAVYEASGSVLGVIRNQFSLSEHAGHLRVVTTVGDPWSDESESFVRVLRQRGDELWTLGNRGWGFDAYQPSRLEINDLHTLAHLGRIDL